jgi:hypothetical protein
MENKTLERIVQKDNVDSKFRTEYLENESKKLYTQLKTGIALSAITLPLGFYSIDVGYEKGSWFYGIVGGLACLFGGSMIAEAIKIFKEKRKLNEDLKNVNLDGHKMGSFYLLGNKITDACSYAEMNYGKKINIPDSLESLYNSENSIGCAFIDGMQVSKYNPPYESVSTEEMIDADGLRQYRSVAEKIPGKLVLKYNNKEFEFVCLDLNCNSQLYELGQSKAKFSALVDYSGGIGKYIDIIRVCTIGGNE